MATHCHACGEPLEAFDPDDTSRPMRLAFDPNLGRLWQVCLGCGRWNPIPLEDRWETLEACETLATREGRILVRGDDLDLLAAGETQLVRVGEPLRLEFSDWRYSRRLDGHAPGGGGFLTRMILDLPERSAGGVSFHGVPLLPDVEWITSPFQEHAPLLGALFVRVPLVESCPSCGDPLVLDPRDFGDVQLVKEGSHHSLVATCALCGTTSPVPLADARPTLRVALAIVGRDHREPEEIADAVSLLDKADGPEGLIEELGEDELALGEMETSERIALAVGLDEAAEAEALEAEWKEAEEVAAIMDGELTDVPGFAEFKKRVLGGEE